MLKCTQLNHKLLVVDWQAIWTIEEPRIYLYKEVCISLQSSRIIHDPPRPNRTDIGDFQKQVGKKSQIDEIWSRSIYFSLHSGISVGFPPLLAVKGESLCGAALATYITPLDGDHHS